MMWNCTCLLCGKDFVVRSYNLISGNTKSCGCMMKERLRETKRKDLTGQKFGYLTVLREDKPRERPDGRMRRRWLCRCECGNEVVVLGESLMGGGTRSCGCYRTQYSSDRYTEDLTGQRFNHLTVLRRVSPPGERVKWECQCDCGKIAEVYAICLKRGITQSCGCKRFSLAEECLARALDANGIIYKKEYTFPD